MCFHEFYFSTTCGHHFPKLPPSAKPNVFFKDYPPTIAVPQSLTCLPVKLALKFYHDQVVYLPADMNCGAKVDIPKSCPIVHRPRDGPTKRTIREHDKAEVILSNNMLENGLGDGQKWQVEINAANLDQCSNRAKPGEHNAAELRRHKEQAYPRNMYAHVQNVKAFQSRDKRLMKPNVIYTNVDFGCGGPFSAECLTGWDGVGLLTQRLHLWSDTTTHPKACNHECLAGWSGADLDTYRQQIWAGDNLKNWMNRDYTKFTRDYVPAHTEHWAVIDYSNVSHLHADQFDWNGRQYVRKYELPNGQVVHVPEMVSVPVPERLDQVLRAMERVPPPEPPLLESADFASIEDILGRLPEAFDEEVPLTEAGSEPLALVAEGSESDTTAVDEPEEEPEEEPEPEPTTVETPEMAEVRRQRARREMREKIARDFSKDKGKMVVEEESGSAESEMAEQTGETAAEAGNDGVVTESPVVKTTIAMDHPNPGTTQTAASPSTQTPGTPPTKPPTSNSPQVDTPSPTAPPTSPDRHLREPQTHENQRLGLPSPDLDGSNRSPSDKI